jgi:hypothetical protein
MIVDGVEQTVECEKCGEVEHQQIPEDTAHCPCHSIYDEEFGVGWRDECKCPCHKDKADD